jgi:hypothetical protein
MTQLLLTVQTEPKTGHQLRDAILEDLERRNRDWLERARKFAMDRACLRGEVSINDVRENVPMPADLHPNVLGAVFKGGSFKQVGWTTASHPKAHARAVRVYTLAWNEEYENGR